MENISEFSAHVQYLEKRIDEYIRNGSDIEWNIVRDFISDIRIEFQSSAFLQLVEITKLLERYKCRDISIIADVLRLATLICSKTIVCFPVFWITLNDLMRDIRSRSVNSGDGNSLYGYQKLFTLPYKRAHQEVDPHEDIVTHAALFGKSKVLRMLLRFGAVMLNPDDTVDERENCKTVIKKLFAKGPDISQIRLPSFDNILLKEFNPSSRRRLFLVIRGLTTIIKIRFYPETAMNFVACLNMLFESIPQPTITSVEIKVDLQKLLCGVIAEEKIAEVSKEFARYFPGSQEHFTPRCLQHLSRCQIRENLRTTRYLPYGVHSLPLPMIMKKYILLE